ncbi:hypothetical protein F5X99DRAFT_413203 [Biscogniauxia marginata]|nr:hypothetical protein F5X99DRAFT_413203 [Biscogniauxia marginata]
MAAPDQPDEAVHLGSDASENGENLASQIGRSSVTELFGLDDRETRDLFRVQRVNYELHTGDTMIIIRFPRLEFADCNGEEWTTKQFRMRSDQLLATGSSVFRRLLSPASQAQTARRLRQEGFIIPCPYVLDLTPPTEGDESAAMLIQASLSTAVRAWWTSHERLSISSCLVSGHDDHCANHRHVPQYCEKTATDASQRSPNGVLDLDCIKPSSARDIDDFCPIRFRANIVRLLMSINGAEFVLNSAPRVYTLACVANFLDCINLVRDDVTVWMMADPNVSFIDINAEDALKISWMLQMADVTRVSFRIIVAERALAILGATATIHDAENNEQPFGRPRATVTDDQATSIQYAAQKFADRVQTTFEKFMSDDVFDWLQIPEWRKINLIEVRIETIFESDLSSLRNSPLEVERPPYGLLNEALSALKSLKEASLRFLRDAVEEALALRVAEPELIKMDCDRSCYIGSSQFTNTSTVYDGLNRVQRLMVPAFWKTLKEIVCDRRKIESLLHDHAEDMNFKAAMTLCPQTYARDVTRGGNDEFTFRPSQFYYQLFDKFTRLRDNWASPTLEIELTRTDHLVLALSDDEFKFLPLWAGGLDDGTGGVYESSVPDAELGPIGPGPFFRTGGTVATDVSSINQSAPTMSVSGTVTMTAGRSLAAAHSEAGDTAVGSERQASTGHTASNSGEAVVVSSDDSPAWSGGESDNDADNAAVDDDDDDIWELLGSTTWSVVDEDDDA